MPEVPEKFGEDRSTLIFRGGTAPGDLEAKVIFSRKQMFVCPQGDGRGCFVEGVWCRGRCGVEGVSARGCLLRGVPAQGGLSGCVCPSSEMATAIVGTHPTGMHTC